MLPFRFSGLKVRTQVSVSLRSSQVRHPQDVLRPFKAGMLGSSPAGIIWPIRLMVRTAASQVANVEFKSRMGHCGYSLKVSTSDCGSENSGSIPSANI